MNQTLQFTISDVTVFWDNPIDNCSLKRGKLHSTCPVLARAHGTCHMLALCHPWPLCLAPDSDKE